MIESGSTPSKAVHALRDALKAHGRESLLPRVARAFQRLSAREEAKTSVTLTVAREHDERSAAKAAREILAQHGIEAGDLKTRVDDTIIGGWRLEGREILVDASYKQQLLDLYNRVTA
jgi:F0F1-type ATP synthase delta subunit